MHSRLLNVSASKYYLPQTIFTCSMSGVVLHVTDVFHWIVLSAYTLPMTGAARPASDMEDWDTCQMSLKHSMTIDHVKNK